METEQGESTPMFLNLLSTEDQKAYKDLQSILAAKDHRYNRNKRIVTFQDMLSQIKEFCVRGDSNDWKRYLVCGICWINNDIAINTRQLRILLGKSKSTINGAFSKMGYETLPFKNNDNHLEEIIPFLKGNFSEARQWTVRRNISNAVSDTEKIEEVKSPEPIKYAKTPEPIVEYQAQEQDFNTFDDFNATEFSYDQIIEPAFDFKTDFNFDAYETSALKFEEEYPFPPQPTTTNVFAFKYF